MSDHLDELANRFLAWKLPQTVCADLCAKLEALEAHKAAAPLCEKHAPNGGARSGCLVCSGMRLSGALSKIDYICGEPNEYEFSQYDADFDEARVVGRVKTLRAKLEAAEKAIKDHNDCCQNACGRGDQEAVACKYRPYFEANGRRCTQCPVYDMIDYPAAIAAGGDDAKD